MRKSILLLSGVGIGAGLLFALRRGSNTKDQAQDGSANGKPRRSVGASSDESTVEATGGRLGSDRNGRGIHSGSSKGQATNAAKDPEPEIDDRGTGQQEAAKILKNIRDAAFDSSDEKLALALGRPTEEIEAWTSGDGTIDGDVVMKARVLAVQRGVEIQ